MSLDNIQFPIAPLNDIFNARVFAMAHQGEILWVKNKGGWHIWRNIKWEYDQNEEVKNKMIDIFDCMRTRQYEGTPEMREAWIRHVKGTGQNARLHAALDCAKALLSSRDIVFDNNPFLLNCPNGIVDLKNGMLIPHHPSFYQTKLCEVNYNKDAECPRWQQFLKEIFLGDVGMIHYIQKVIGYALTGSIREECFFILYGTGGNGKSKFIETIAWILKDYATSCESKTILERKNAGINNDIARLVGTRFVRTSENNKNINLDDSLMKSLTGGDKITARFLHCEHFEFYPNCKIFLSTNHKPGIGGTDDGIWRRIRMVPFDLKLKEGEIDFNLGDKLKEEAEGILNWAVEGCLLWQLDGLTPPLKVQRAIDEYKEEEDRIGGFIQDECEIIREGYIPISLFKDKLFLYLGHRMGQKTICSYMRQRGFYEPDFARTTIDGQRVRIFHGLTLKTQRMIDNTPPIHKTDFEKRREEEGKDEDDQGQIDWETWHLMTRKDFQDKHSLTDDEMILLEKIIKMFKGKIIEVVDRPWPTKNAPSIKRLKP